MKLYIVLIFLVFTSTVYSQQIIIKGTVSARSSGAILQGATLVLQKGNKATASTTSNKNGEFVFTGLLPQKVQLITRYLSFKADTQHINLKRDTTLKVILDSAVQELAEVKVKSSVSPITLRKDTLSFNARAYKTRPNATLEDLLRLLSGVKVDNDGNITMNGQKVNEIMIEGKSYPVGDLKTFTKNITADMISKVEVFTSNTEEERQAGIVSMNNNKTINLKLKDDKKNGYTGKSYLAAGNNGYAAGANIFGLDPRKMYSLQVNIDNINGQFKGTEGLSAQAGPGRQNAALGNFFGSYPISKKLDLAINVVYDYQKNNQQGKADRQTFLTDSSLFTQGTSNSVSKSTNLNAFARLSYKANDHTTIGYNLLVSPTSSSSATRDTTLLNIHKPAINYTSSYGLTNNSSNQTGMAFTNALNLVHKFSKPGESFIATISNSIFNRSQQDNIFTSVKTFNPASLKIVNQQVSTPVKTRRYNAVMAYQHPLSKNLMMVTSYLFNNSQSESIKRSDNFNDLTGGFDLRDTLNSDNFNSYITTHTLTTDLTNAGFNSKLRYSVNFGIQSYKQENNNITAILDSRSMYYSFLPSAFLDINLKNNKQISLSYFGMAGNPTLDQLQPLPDLSNPYLLKLGNPGLHQSYTHRLQSSYSFYNTLNAQSIRVDLGADLTRHQISSATTTLAGGVQQIQFVNLDGVYHFNAAANYSFPLIKPENGTGSVGVKANYNHDHNIINGLDNITRGKGVTGDFMLNYHKGNNLFIEFDGSVEYLLNNFSLNQQPGGKSLQQNYNVNFAYIFASGLNIGSIYNIQLRSGGNLPAQQSGLLTTFIAQDVLENKAGQIRLSGFNLLDASSAINQTIGQNYTETSQTNRLHRLILLSFVYNFKKFRKGG